jgi:hypothetical protein
MARVKIGNVFPPVEYLLRHCAPAGYGLGDKGFHTYDLNNALDCGWYAFSDTAENTPFGYGIALVLNRFDVDIVQVAFSTTMFASNFNGAIARRMYTEDAWSEWEFINPPMEVGVEYRTTERWMGKPVYTSLVNAGAYPETGLRNAETGIVATGIVRFHASAGYASLPRAGSMEINTFHNNGKLIVQLNTTGERINNNDVYVTLYYIKN